MGQMTTLALRGVLVVLLAGSVFVQAVMVPLIGADLEEGTSELAYPRAAFLVVLVLGVVTVQVVLVCVWRLVTMVRRGTVFSHAAFHHVDVVLWAIAAAAVLLSAFGYMLAPGEAVAPGVVLLVGGVVVAALGVALIVLVLRMLLAQAVARDVEAARLEAELQGVI
ncbi:DUF2975 domain-containing protein [Streptomyces sp. NPDC089424]|uniref:DUF2975 domain-containing protein n=1 Tax=Streptomyces sp. NPDC089424 TaxID=3365917 RepID=UPI003824AEEB